MRDLIVMSIKQFITLLIARDTTIDTRCALSRVKKTYNVKLETDSGENDTNFLEVQKNYNEARIFQPDLIQEVNNMFTSEEISVSVVGALIHVSVIAG